MKWVLRLKVMLGLDRAIAYTPSTRVWTVVSNVGSVVLMLHFLFRVEPGFYFTLLSLVTLQVVFELGFSFVIQQLAAHEYAHLTPGSDGTLLGDAIRHARFASILQLTVRWYGRAAIAVGVVLMPVGIGFARTMNGPVSRCNGSFHGSCR
jgi:hypothetical protein